MINLVINSRPYSTKNNRQLARKRSFINKVAKKALDEAKWGFKQQWKKKPSKEKHNIEISIFYKDKRSWLDPDNAAAFVLDALKGIVIEDDSPTYIGDLLVRSPELSRQGRAHIDVVLKKV